MSSVNDDSWLAGFKAGQEEMQRRVAWRVTQVKEAASAEVRASYELGHSVGLDEGYKAGYEAWFTASLTKTEDLKTEFDRAMDEGIAAFVATERNSDGPLSDTRVELRSSGTP